MVLEERKHSILILQTISEHLHPSIKNFMSSLIVHPRSDKKILSPKQLQVALYCACRDFGKSVNRSQSMKSVFFQCKSYWTMTCFSSGKSIVTKVIGSIRLNIYIYMHIFNKSNTYPNPLHCTFSYKSEY